MVGIWIWLIQVVRWTTRLEDLSAILEQARDELLKLIDQLGKVTMACGRAEAVLMMVDKQDASRAGPGGAQKSTFTFVQMMNEGIQSSAGHWRPLY